MLRLFQNTPFFFWKLCEDVITTTTLPSVSRATWMFVVVAARMWLSCGNEEGNFLFSEVFECLCVRGSCFVVFMCAQTFCQPSRVECQKFGAAERACSISGLMEKKKVTHYHSWHNRPPPPTQWQKIAVLQNLQFHNKVIIYAKFYIYFKKVFVSKTCNVVKLTLLPKKTWFFFLTMKNCSFTKFAILKQSHYLCKIFNQLIN